MEKMPEKPRCPFFMAEFADAIKILSQPKNFDQLEKADLIKNKQQRTQEIEQIVHQVCLEHKISPEVTAAVTEFALKYNIMFRWP